VIEKSRAKRGGYPGGPQAGLMNFAPKPETREGQIELLKQQYRGAATRPFGGAAEVLNAPLDEGGSSSVSTRPGVEGVSEGGFIKRNSVRPVDAS
jgi:hypothetical protein